MSISFSQSEPFFITRPVIYLLVVLSGLNIHSFAQTQTAAKDTATATQKPAATQRPGARAPAPAVLPGNGLKQHDFLYAGGWDTRKDTQTIFRVMGGRVIWTWSIPIKDRNGQL